MPQPNDEPEPVTIQRPARRLGCGGVLLGLALVLAGLAAFVFYRLESFPGRVRDAFAAVAGAQPRVTVNEQVVYEQTSPVLELAVTTREMLVERVTTDTWLGSTKQLRVRGTYRVKVGFDLTQPCSVTIDGTLAQSVHVQMPPPRVLSVELEKMEVLAANSGLWNHVKPEEYAQEVNALNTDARLKAIHDGMMAEAKKMFAAQLSERIGPGHPVEVVTGPGGVPFRK